MATSYTILGGALAGSTGQDLAGLRYLVRATTDGDPDSSTGAEAGAWEHAVNNSPGTYNGLPRAGATAQITDAPGVFSVEVEYRSPKYTRPDPPETGDTESGSGEVLGEVVTLKVHDPSRQTKYPSSGGDEAPDMNGAINVGPDEVRGVEIIVPTMSFEEVRYVSVLPRGAIYSLTGTVNNAPITIDGALYATAELLYRGARWARRPQFDDYVVTHSFSAAPTKTDLAIGGITGITKPGHDYLWVKEGVRLVPLTTIGGTAYLPLPSILGVYVEQVYDRGDFTLLGL